MVLVDARERVPSAALQQYAVELCLAPPLGLPREGVAMQFVAAFARPLV